jgi:phosphate transport system permease protein
MSATEIGKPGTLGTDADPQDREAAARRAQEDPAASPAQVHDNPAVAMRVPAVRAARGAKVLDPEVATSATTTAPQDRTSVTSPGAAPGEKRSGVKLAKISRTGDRVFGFLAAGSGVAIVALVLFVGIFLLALALPALLQNQDNFLTSRNWVVAGDELRFGIAGLLWTTVLSSVLAMVMAVPVAVGVALFLTQYSPRRLSGPLSFVVDLLAAVPSIIFGLWGLTVLGPFLSPAGSWISDKLGFIPLFSASIDPRSSVFVASVVLAIMILPIITAISRDVFAQTPRDHIEAALSLGATRWEVIRTSVLPYGRSGVISASMLGLGRALGETVAVLIILSQAAPGSAFTPSIFAGGETFASKIANNASEFDTPSKTGAFIAAGLVLFVVTFIVNAVARMIADRGSAKS